MLDEPSGGVAQKETEALGPLLLRVREHTGCSILVIEHDMPLLSSICDELVALETGRHHRPGHPRRGARAPRGDRVATSAPTTPRSTAPAPPPEPRHALGSPEKLLAGASQHRSRFHTLAPVSHTFTRSGQDRHRRWPGAHGHRQRQPGVVLRRNGVDQCRHAGESGHSTTSPPARPRRAHRRRRRSISRTPRRPTTPLERGDPHGSSL